MFHASHRLGAHSGRPWLCFSASTLRCGQRIEFVLMITGALKTESCKLYGYACSLERPGFRILKRLWGIQSVLRLSESRAKETILKRILLHVLLIVCARKPSSRSSENYCIYRKSFDSRRTDNKFSTVYTAVHNLRPCHSFWKLLFTMLFTEKSVLLALELDGQHGRLACAADTAPAAQPSATAPAPLSAEKPRSVSSVSVSVCVSSAQRSRRAVNLAVAAVPPSRQEAVDPVG